MEVCYHPAFAKWLHALHLASPEAAANVYALTTALEDYGRELGDPESHPVVTSRLDMHALRRTMHSLLAPANGPLPVLRVLYAYCHHPDRSELAVVLLGGDKSHLGNHWYPGNIKLAESRLHQYAVMEKVEPITKRGGH